MSNTATHLYDSGGIIPLHRFVPPAVEPTSVTIQRWYDDQADARGHDPRSAYVERFWLGVIGPTPITAQALLQRP